MTENTFKHDKWYFHPKVQTRLDREIYEHLLHLFIHMNLNESEGLRMIIHDWLVLNKDIEYGT